MVKCSDCDMISISVEMRDGCAVKFNSCVWVSHVDINVERECHHFDPKRMNLDEKMLEMERSISTQKRD